MSDKEQVLQTLLDAANGEIGALTAECERLAGMANGSVAASVQHQGWKRPILYTDTINGVQTCRDDLWAVTTGELSALDSRPPSAPSVDRNAVLEEAAAVADAEYGAARARFNIGQEWSAGTIAQRIRTLKSAAPAKPEPAVEAPYGWINAGTERQQTEFATLNVGPQNPWVDSANAFPVYIAPVAQPLAPSGAVPVATDYKLQDGEVIFYSRLGRSDDGLPFMTDSDHHGVWDVAMVFRPTHKRPSHVFVEPYYAVQPLAGQDGRAVTERDGWSKAAKAIAERAAGHYKLGNYELQDECLQCASMLHDLKPAPPSPVNPKQEQ